MRDLLPRPPYWFFPLPVWSHIILVRPNGKPVPENVGIAFVICNLNCKFRMKTKVVNSNNYDNNNNNNINNNFIRNLQFKGKRERLIR